MPSKTTLALFRVAAALGLAWSAFGIVQYLSTVGADAEAFRARGMTEAQAAVMAAVPAWMDAAFAVGVFGGAFGALGLLLRARWARPLLLASLAGYVALFAGDWAKDVFAALGTPQLVILSFVVAVAVALVWLDAVARRRALIG